MTPHSPPDPVAESPLDPVELALRFATRLLPDVASASAYTGPSTPGGGEALRAVRELPHGQAAAVVAVLGRLCAGELPVALSADLTADTTPELQARARRWLGRRIDAMTGHHHQCELWAAQVTLAMLDGGEALRLPEKPGGPIDASVPPALAGLLAGLPADVPLSEVAESLAYALALYLSRSMTPDGALVALVRAVPGRGGQGEPQDAGQGAGLSAVQGETRPASIADSPTYDEFMRIAARNRAEYETVMPRMDALFERHSALCEANGAAQAAYRDALDSGDPERIAAAKAAADEAFLRVSTEGMAVMREHSALAEEVHRRGDELADASRRMRQAAQQHQHEHTDGERAHR